MGAFHEGHRSLMRAAVGTGYDVVVSLFVNPSQFGADEDLAAYPRRTEDDAATAESEGVKVLFIPDAGSMYAPDHAAWVRVPSLERTLCGLSRPGHFQGVCTVVLKLFMLAQPQLAFFGEKDWQQLAVIRRMTRDLNLPTEIRACPTVREADGLALSSRNVYLSPEERAQAPHLYAGLQKARLLAGRGERRAEALCTATRGHWAARMPLGREEYLSLVDPHDLQPAAELESTALLAAAVRFGKTRLIDNILLTAPDPENAAVTRAGAHIHPHVQ
jgi:pantoate--beta-alanine ligase